MMDVAPRHGRFVRLIQFMKMLENHKLTVHSASERLDINIRTVYRYVNVLCAAGIDVKQKRGLYWIDKN